jgi:hypothetical protein
MAGPPSDKAAATLNESSSHILQSVPTGVKYEEVSYCGARESLWQPPTGRTIPCSAEENGPACQGICRNLLPP